MRRLLACLALGLSSAAAEAQQIDMSALPPRESVQLTIYNSADLTLVRETRHVTVRKGLNTLQFSWANTLIDPTSVRIEFPKGPAGLELTDTVYPHARPEVLYWNVRSEADGEAAVAISYFTSGITWSADYVGIADPAEGSMAFDGYVTVTNHSGEDYADAQIRLVVGTVNLVERIEDLSRTRQLRFKGAATEAENKPQDPGNARDEGRLARLEEAVDKAGFAPDPVAIEWRFPIDGDVTVRQSLGASLHDFRSPLWNATVAPGETKELAWELARKQGSSAKQNKVELAN